MPCPWYPGAGLAWKRCSIFGQGKRDKGGSWGPLLQAYLEPPWHLLLLLPTHTQPWPSSPRLSLEGGCLMRRQSIEALLMPFLCHERGSSSQTLFSPVILLLVTPHLAPWHQIALESPSPMPGPCRSDGVVSPSPRDGHLTWAWPMRMQHCPGRCDWLAEVI